jgi:hypothetical protein
MHREVLHFFSNTPATGVARVYHIGVSTGTVEEECPSN